MTSTERAATRLRLMLLGIPIGVALVLFAAAVIVERLLPGSVW